MNISFFKKKYFEIVLIENNAISYFRLTKIKNTIKVLNAQKIETNIYQQNILQLENLEKSFELFIKKYKLFEVGIVLHLSNILFQKITLPRSGNPQEIIANYLKTTFPLPLENYSLIYKEDRYKLAPTLANFNLILIDKKIIENLLKIIEKHNLIPLFIVPSVEVFYQYLLDKTLIDFNEENLVYFIDQNILVTILIKNLKIEKILIEEVNIQKIDYHSIILRVYNFFKPNLSPETKILFFNAPKEKFSEIQHQQLFFSQKPIEILIEGSYLIFEKIFSDQEISDFLPIRPYMAYFLNRLPSIVTFLSVYVLLLIFIFSGVYFLFSSRFNQEIKSLNEEIKRTPTKTADVEAQLNQLIEISKLFDFPAIKNFDKIKELLTINNLEEINFNSQEALSFSLKVKKDDWEQTKFQISQKFPQIKLIKEETLENEVRLFYSF